MPIKVLFVCLGNICRSPMCEVILKDMVEKRGLTDQFEIRSAGTLKAVVNYSDGTQDVIVREVSVK